MANTVKDGIATRKIAILAADGVDEAAISSMKKALQAAGAQAMIVAPRLGTVRGLKGGQVPVDFSLLTASSVLFDALYVPGGEGSIDILKGDAKVLVFIPRGLLTLQDHRSDGCRRPTLVGRPSGPGPDSEKSCRRCEPGGK